MSETTRNRDDFSKPTKEKLAKRVGYLCSKPDCRKPTIGPASTEEGTISIGVAAHVKAASPEGKRYDPKMTSDERKAPANGIWLCQDHAKLIDSDESFFTVELLHKWKKIAVERSLSELALGKIKPQEPPSVDDKDVHSAFDLATESCKADANAFRRMQSWPPYAIQLNLRLTSGESKQDLTASGLALAADLFDEIGVIAPPGTGKTTTLLQVVESILLGGLIAPIFIPLSEWATDDETFFRSILKRPTFRTIREEHLNLLAEHGCLGLALDGWNELDDASKKRARKEIASLRRIFPDLIVIVSSRSEQGDFPIDGPSVEIGNLSEEQQLVLAKAIRPDDGESLIEHARRTPGLRDLIAIPLYITALLKQAAGGSLPNTKEEVLRLFVESAERDPEKQANLREELKERHRDFLEAVAVEATHMRVTALSDGQTRAVVNLAQESLKRENQIASVLEPMKIIDTLVSSHLIVRSASGSLAFQHQQFQEWFASFYVERLMRASFAGDEAAKKKLREEILNIPAWQEAVLFACERMSFGGQDGAKAVAAAAIITLGIDPMLTAEMIWRSSESAWEQAGESIISFAKKWHSAGKIDRAFRFMVATGRKDFAEYVWPLISNPNGQIHLSALRATYPFRPTVLGPEIHKRVAALSEEVRASVVSEIASNSRMDGISLATSLAVADPSSKVQLSVVEALAFRHASGFLRQILDRASEDVWRGLAERWHPSDFTDSTIAARLEKEACSAHGKMTNPVQILNTLLRPNVYEPEKAATVQALVEKIDFKKGSNDAEWAIPRLYQVYPKEIAAAFVSNLEKGMPIPFIAKDVLAESCLIIEDGPLVELVLKGEADTASTAASVVGPKVIGQIIDQLCAVERKRKVGEKYDEALSAQSQQLVSRISRTNVHAFAQALLGHATKDPTEISILADLISRHGRRDNEGPINFAPADRERIVKMVDDWGKILLASPEASREDLSEMAAASERLKSPDLVPMLLELLSMELKRWRAEREEFQKAMKERRERPVGAQTIWTERYKRALIAIGNDDVINAAKSYLRDPDFGHDAAIILRVIWRNSQTPANDSRFFKPSPDFSVVPEAFARLQSGANQETHPFSDAIMTVVRDLIKPGADEKENLHAIKLANVALGMPLENSEETINSLLNLPRPYGDKSELLTALALSGRTISSDFVLKGIEELLADAKVKTWLLDQDGWRLKKWLQLLAFTEKPTVIMDVLDRAEGIGKAPWDLREVLSALTYSPSPDSETVLNELAKRDKRFVHEYDWSVALLSRGTINAARIFLEQLCSNTGGGDSSGLGKTLSALIASHQLFRKEVYERYKSLSDGSAKSIIGYAIAEVPDIEGILLLVRDAAVKKRPFGSTQIEWAIRGYLIDRSSDETKANEVHASGLRKALFSMAIGENADESRLAKMGLSVTDDVLDEYGRLEIDVRHPDISTGIPWPQVESVVTGV